jgi:hypothetical protein
MEWEDAPEKLQLLLLLESKGSFLTESTEATPRLVKQLSELLPPPMQTISFRYKKWVKLAEKKKNRVTSVCLICPSSCNRGLLLFLYTVPLELLCALVELRCYIFEHEP